MLKKSLKGQDTYCMNVRKVVVNFKLCMGWSSLKQKIICSSGNGGKTSAETFKELTCLDHREKLVKLRG